MPQVVGVVNSELYREHTDGTSGYDKEYAISSDVFRIMGGAPTPVDPDANTLGGYQLDAVGEELTFKSHMDTEWDEASDILIEIIFETNVDNGGGLVTDTVDLKLDVFMKGEGETATKNQTLEVATVVGQAAQFKQFAVLFTLDFDHVTDPVDPGDTISMVLNLETDTSEVDDVIVNYAEFKYRTTSPGLLRT